MQFVYGYARTFLVALGLSLVLTLIIRAAARRLSLVAKPRADRWHKKPTALFGGVAIFIAFALTIGVLERPAPVPGLSLLLLCTTGMFIVGLVDDIVQLKPYAKMIGQILIATALTTFGLRLHWLPSPVLDQSLTIFWLVGVTNATNLLDNLDGLAGGVSSIAAIYLVYFCHAGGFATAASLAAAFAGAILGFLVFNFNPASIFMGDCGSLFLGFFLGAITLVNNQTGFHQNIVSVLAIPLLLMLIPIVDTTLVTISRRMHGRPVSQGGRDHTSHRLVALGFSERSATLVLWTASALAGGVAVVVRNSSWMIGAFLVPTFFLACLFVVGFVANVKVYERVEDDRDARGRALLPTLADFTYKRRILEVASDLVVVVLAYYGAFLLRFEGELVRPFYALFVETVPVVIALQLAAFLLLGLYDGLWRYTSMSDLSRQMRAVFGGWTASTLAVVFLFRMENISRSVLILDGVLLLFGVGGTRVAFRLLRTWLGRLPVVNGGKRVLIYGAGDGGELLVRELYQNSALGLFPVGFVDDDPKKAGRVIHGIRVLGSLERVRELASQKQIEEIVVSTTKLAADRRELLDLVCNLNGIRYRRMRISLE